MEKYEATLLALRDGSLHPRYKTIIEYEAAVEEQSSQAGVYVGLVFFILGFMALVGYTGWKIRYYHKRILDDNTMMEKEKGKLVGYQDEVIRLRKIKLMQTSLADKKK